MGIFEQRANLNGKRAVVIGGADGIGKAVTLALATAGLDIAFCDINAAAVETTRAEVAALGREVLSEVADATQSAQLETFYGSVAAKFEHIDVLVNIVGGVFLTPFSEKTAASCAEDIQRNYGYVLDSIRNAVPLLRKTGHGGSIINFTTIEAHRGAAGFSVYAGAKAATTNFSRALACELGSERIRVNIIAPDSTPSAGNYNALPQSMRDEWKQFSPQQWGEMLKMYIPLGAAPSAEDLADTVLFLASDLSRSITGQVIHVDGGTSASLGFIHWPLDGAWLPVPGAKTLAKLF